MLSSAWDDEAARGFIFGSDDPSMGWGRYAESMRIANLEASLVSLQATHEAHALCALMASRGRAEQWTVAPGSAFEHPAPPLATEASALTAELLAPAHDGTTRVGASVRVLHRECWLGGRAAHATLLERSRARPSPRRPAALLAGRHDGKEAAAARLAAASAFFHSPSREPVPSPDAEVTSRVLGQHWPAGTKLPWRHAMERTRVDALMGAPLRWAR